MLTSTQASRSLFDRHKFQRPAKSCALLTEAILGCRNIFAGCQSSLYLVISLHTLFRDAWFKKSMSTLKARLSHERCLHASKQSFVVQGLPAMSRPRLSLDAIRDDDPEVRLFAMTAQMSKQLHCFAKQSGWRRVLTSASTDPQAFKAWCLACLTLFLISLLSALPAMQEVVGCPQ